MGETVPVISVRDLDKSFPGVQALKKVSFDLLPREIHAVVGENGAGKSTLIKILSGMYGQDAGEIYVHGAKVEAVTPRVMQDLGIQTIYQERNLVPYLSVAENVSLNRLPIDRYRRIDWKRMRGDAAAVLRQVGLDIDPRVPLRSLGSAQQQMVEIAKALSQKSRVLIMDEPTASLNASEIEILFKIVRGLKAEGLAVIYISHHLEEIFQISDRTTVLRDGQRIDTRNTIDLDREALVFLMAGTKIQPVRRRDTASKETIVLELRNISRGRRPRNITLQLHRGEVLCLAGMVGAGRTELARILFGVDQPDEGEIIVGGRRIRNLTPHKAKRLGLAFLPEDRKYDGIVPAMDVIRNITLASLERVMSWAGISGRKEREVAEHYQRDLRIVASSMDKEVQYLSGGNQQKVVLAKWLAADADIFIFDEPTKGIDVASKEEIYGIIMGLAARGKGILIISSDLEEIMKIADRVVVMNSGTIAAELQGDELTNQNILMHACRPLAQGAGQGDR